MKEEFQNPVLDSKAIAFLRSAGSEITYGEGEYVLRQGQRGEAFYVITRGRVKVGVHSTGDETLWLDSLGEGNFFGEISLLIPSPVTADVVAMEGLTVVACRKNAFLEVLSRSPSLGAVLSQSLAWRLASNTTDLWGLHQQRQALNALMGYRRKSEPLIAESSAMQKVADQIQEFKGYGARALLLYGSAGTGKTYVASLVHSACLEDHAPFIVADCRSFCSEDAVTVLFGAGFSGDGDCCGEGGDAYRPFGAVDLAEGGTFVLRHIDALSLGSQEKLLEYLSGLYGRKVSPLQLVATTRKRPEELTRDGLLHPGMDEMLDRFTLRVPDLRERRRDILPLATHFLKSCEGQSVFRFTPAAEKKLLSLDFSNRNTVELKEMVELAVQVSDGVDIDEDHLFAESVERKSPLEFNLQRSPTVRWLTRPGTLSEAKAAILLGFLAVMGLSIFRSDFTEGQIANAVIWSFWEPLLFSSFFLVGRAWCTVCPISTAGKAIAGVFRLDRAPPDWLKRGGGTILIFGFAGIIWAEHYFVMPANPLPSGVLLLILFALASLFAVLYQRETWCRHACPLGGLGAAYSTPAILTVKANAHICSNYCNTHDCYKGTAKSTGCPVFRHPLHSAESHNCKLCLSCLDVCPHGASNLHLRPPLMTVWHTGPLDETIILFAFFLFFFGPAMLASKGATWAGTHTGFGLTTLAALFMALLFHRKIPDFLGGYEGLRGVLLSRVALSLLVLAWGPIMAYQMVNIRGLSLLVLHVREGNDLFASIGEISLLFLLQASFIVLAGILSAIAFWRVRHEAAPYMQAAWDPGWKLLALFCAGYVFLNILIVLY